MKSDFKPIVRHIKTNELYSYEGENKFTNLRTKQSGIVDDDKASKVFKINVEMTQLINEFPIIETMINKLNLIYNK